MDGDVNGSANCLAPGVTVGEYRLLGAIGEGGFGIVYRALDLTLDRVVAIKEYMPSTLAGRKSSNQIHVRSQHRGAFDAGLRSFINEARLLAKFSHPALVHVYRFFEENGTAYMVMRYYEGQTLREFLESHEGSVSQPWLEAMLTPILDVLEMLHAADCYHRDIAPDNIFLQDSGVPVLLDFGAARRIIGDMTQALTMVLKPGFAPIEQYVEDGAMPQGAWTDVYQIGAVVYLAITGKPPATSVARMINDPMPVLSAQNYPGYTPPFYAGVQRALAVKPQDRAQSIAELKAQLGIASFASPVIEPRVGSGFAPLMPSAVPVPAVSSGNRQGPQNTTPLSAMKTVPRSGEAAVPPPSPKPVAVSPMSDQRPAQAAAPQSVAGARAVPADATASPPRQKTLLLAAGLLLVVLAVAWWGSRSGVLLSPAQLAELEEARRWQAVVEQPNQENLAAYRAAFPNGKHSEQAQRLVLGLAPSEQVATEVATDSTPQSAKSPSEAASAAAPATRNDPVSDVARPSAGTGAAVVTAAAPAQTAPATDAGRLTLPVATGGGAPPPQMPASKMAGAPGDLSGGDTVTAGAAVKASPKAADPANQGQLVLRISPWGRVSVDHAPVGASPPLSRLDLPEGQHRVDISNPSSKVPVTRVIWVKKGEPVVLDHRFE